MCGLVGRASIVSLENTDSWVKAANQKLHHRGPDASGFWCSEDNKVELAHSRLAIVDITESGAQPMINSKHGLSIVFNGEIYNHKEIRLDLEEFGYSFQSKSDTEVILLAYSHWGHKCLDYFNGMFAFAIYDYKKKELFIARDRAGEKPLFYYADNNNISFGSELKALLDNKEIKREIDIESLDCFLSFGFVPSNKCIYSGLNKLESGSWLRFNTSSGEINIKKYWDIPKLQRDKDSPKCLKENLLGEFGSLFKDSISKQLEADVPVGVLLSGGLDSSLVTAIASKYKTGIKTFNVRFPGFGKLDETEHARKISKFYKTDHIELDASISDPELLVELAEQFDEPIIDSSMIPTFLVAKEVKKHCTVALGGDGADELFGGYSHYARILKLNKYIRYLPEHLKNAILKYSFLLLPEDFKGSNWINSLRFDYSKQSPLVASYFNVTKRQHLLGLNEIELIGFAEQFHNEISASDESLLQRITRTDFYTYLIEDILVKVDRASMLNSLEIRAPFLDHRIIDFAFSKVPDIYKVSGSNKKVLLQEYASQILPSSFEFGRKQGFSIPLDSWLKRGPFKDFFYDTLLSKESIFSRTEILKTLHANAAGRNNSEKIFGLVMFELWRKKYNASFKS